MSDIKTDFFSNTQVIDGDIGIDRDEYIDMPILLRLLNVYPGEYNEDPSIGIGLEFFIGAVNNIQTATAIKRHIESKAKEHDINCLVDPYPIDYSTLGLKITILHLYSQAETFSISFSMKNGLFTVLSNTADVQKIKVAKNKYQQRRNL